MNSVIKNNKIRDNAVVSTFFSGVAGNELKFYKIEVNENESRSIEVCFLLEAFLTVFFS